MYCWDSCLKKKSTTSVIIKKKYISGPQPIILRQKSNEVQHVTLHHFIIYLTKTLYQTLSASLRRNFVPLCLQRYFSSDIYFCTDLLRSHHNISIRLKTGLWWITRHWFFSLSATRSSKPGTVSCCAWDHCMPQFGLSFSCWTNVLTSDSRLLCYTEEFMVDTAMLCLFFSNCGAVDCGLSNGKCSRNLVDYLDLTL